MDRQRFITIQEWMLDLGLNGNELIAFALIYGFAQDGATGFRGSIEYVAGWCRVQRRQAIYILKSLVAKGLVTKVEMPGQTCAYFTTKGVQSIAPVQPIAPVQNNAQGGAVDCTGGVQSIAPNNISYKIEDNINIPHTLRAREDDDLVAYGDHVRMTAAEHGKLVARFGTQDTDRLCEILDGYLDNPKRTNRYRSHYRAILGWPVTRLQEEKLTQQRMENAKQQAQRQHGYQQGPPPGNYARLADANRRLKELEEKYK